MNSLPLSKPHGFQCITILKNQMLGHGAYGAIYKAQCDELICAAKLLHPILVCERNIKLFHKECQILSNVRHPNIVLYLGTYEDGPDNTWVLLMELMEESLTSFLEGSPCPLPFRTEVNLCYDISLALAYLHSNGIIHRDLTSNNVLLTGGGRIAKVTDFGMAMMISACGHSSLLTQTPGCPHYMPPEAFDYPPVYSDKLDVFSFGVLTIQILTREIPQPGPPKLKVKDPNYRILIEVPVSDVERRKNHIDLINCDHALLDMVRDCLSYEEGKRPTAKMLCQQLSNVKTSIPYLDSSTPKTIQRVPPKTDEHLGTPSLDLGCNLPESSKQVAVIGQRPLHKHAEAGCTVQDLPKVLTVPMAHHRRANTDPVGCNQALCLDRFQVVTMQDAQRTSQCEQPGIDEQLGTPRIRGKTTPGPSEVVRRNFSKASKQNKGTEQVEVEKQGVHQMKDIKQLIPKQPDVSAGPLVGEFPSPPRLAEGTCAMSQLVSEGPPSIRKVLVSSAVCIKEKCFAKYTIGTEDLYDPAPGRVLLVVGAKGVGKTTLINRLVNHIFDVCWDDPFRLVLETSEEQTSWIKVYTFHKTRGSTLPFTLTVVDTPAYENSGEPLQNRKLAAIIRELFSTSGPLGVDRLHGIMLVVNPTTVSVQKQIDVVMQLSFDAHFSHNIFIAFTGTFSDNVSPLAMGSTEWGNVPVDRINTFDNSILFKSNIDNYTNTQDSLLWKQGAKMFENFIRKIGKMEGRSLLLSVDVMTELKELQVSLSSLQQQIQVRLMQMSKLDQERNMIKLKQGETDRNERIVYKVSIPEQQPVPLPKGQMAMNCQNCKMTCHFPCQVSSDECCVMTSSIRECLACCVCHCTASDHAVCSYCYEMIEQQVTRTSDDLRRQLQSTIGDSLGTSYSLKRAIDMRLDEIRHSVISLIIQAYCCLRHFDDIALKVNPITSDGYLDYLIHSEKQKAISGYAIRVRYLERMRKEVHLQSAEEVRKIQRLKLAKQEESREERRPKAGAMDEFEWMLTMNNSEGRL